MPEQTISAAEWQVMRVVWAHPESTSNYIIMSLQEGFDWQPATIKTLLGRLRKKGYLEMEKIATSYYYRPLISEEAHLQGQIRLLLDNMCSTKHGYLVQEILQAGQFSEKDMVSIENLAQKMERDAPAKVACHCLKGQCTCGCHH